MLVSFMLISSMYEVTTQHVDQLVLLQPVGTGPVRQNQHSHVFSGGSFIFTQTSRTEPELINTQTVYWPENFLVLIS